MNTALVLVDMQNAFCRADGSFARRGDQIPKAASVVAACRRLRAWAGSQRWPVIHTRLVFRPDYTDGGLLVADQPIIRDLRAYAAGTPDAEIVAELAPQPGDAVIDKNRYDPFTNPELERELRRRDIAHLVVAGLVTNVCVESTVRGAYDRGFRVTVVADAVASYSEPLHQAALTTIARHFGRVCTLAELGCP